MLWEDLCLTEIKHGSFKQQVKERYMHSSEERQNIIEDLMHL